MAELDRARDGSAVAVAPRDRGAGALPDGQRVGRPGSDARAKTEGAWTGLAPPGLVRALPGEWIRLVVQRRAQSAAEPLVQVKDAAEVESLRASAAGVQREFGQGAEQRARAWPGLRRFAREGGWARFHRWTRAGVAAPACCAVLQWLRRRHRSGAQRLLRRPAPERFSRQWQVARVHGPERVALRPAPARQSQPEGRNRSVARMILLGPEHAYARVQRPVRRWSWSEFSSR